MRRVVSTSALAAAALAAAGIASATIACGSRTELFDTVGNHLNGNDAGATHHRDAASDDASDGASLDAADARVQADVDAAPPNPCGGYQANSPWPAFQRCS